MIDYGETPHSNTLTALPAREYEGESSRRTKNFSKQSFFTCAGGHPYEEFSFSGVWKAFKTILLYTLHNFPLFFLLCLFSPSTAFMKNIGISGYFCQNKKWRPMAWRQAWKFTDRF